MNKIVKVVALISVLLAVVIFLLMPSPLPYVAEFQDVFNRELPKGCVSVFQQLLVTGRDQDKYSYNVVIQGDNALLLSLVYDIGLDNKAANEYKETQNILSTNMKTRYPVGVKRNSPLQLFEKKGLIRHETDWCYIQAEIIENRLYIFKIAMSRSLRDNIEKKGGVLKLLWKRLAATTKNEEAIPPGEERKKREQ